jgi:hypothetical protein
MTLRVIAGCFVFYVVVLTQPISTRIIRWFLS